MTREELGDEVIDAFLDRVERIPSGCWNWTGTTAGVPGEYEYGYLRLPESLYTSDGREVVTFRATHVAIILLNGYIDDVLDVLHHCDNPRCVNPEHLFLGTQQDNIDDMYAKGRDNARSNLLPEFRLTDNEVAAIRLKRKLGIPIKAVSIRYGITYNYVNRIARKKARRKDTDEYFSKRQRHISPVW
jgi:hypothetical protein